MQPGNVLLKIDTIGAMIILFTSMKGETMLIGQAEA